MSDLFDDAYREYQLASDRYVRRCEEERASAKAMLDRVEEHADLDGIVIAAGYVANHGAGFGYVKIAAEGAPFTDGGLAATCSRELGQWAQGALGRRVFVALERQGIDEYLDIRIPHRVVRLRSQRFGGRWRS